MIPLLVVNYIYMSMFKYILAFFTYPLVQRRLQHISILYIKNQYSKLTISSSGPTHGQVIGHIQMDDQINPADRRRGVLWRVRVKGQTALPELLLGRLGVGVIPAQGLLQELGLGKGGGETIHDPALLVLGAPTEGGRGG